MPTARQLALDTLMQWTALKEPPFLPERNDEEWKELSPRDRAFAFDLLTGIIRWRATLDAIIASRLRQPLDLLDHPVRVILWLGAYQLLFQEGTTDYAAVDTTVALAKNNRSTAKASGLINAVLRGITRLAPTTIPREKVAPDARLSRRGFARDFDTHLLFNEDLFPDFAKALPAHLAAVRSHPVAFVNRLRAIYGDDVTGELLLRNNLRPVVTFRVDAGSLDVQSAAGLVAHADTPRFLVAAEGWNANIEALVRAGTLSPQDPTSAKPVRRAAELVADDKLGRPLRILDLCAGLGTKSIQLARAFPKATLTATDIDDVKLERLAGRAKQIGQKNITIAPSAATAALEAPDAAKFDLVFVDVPCSNTGVMAKRVQSRWRWPSLDHAALHELQERLLAQGSRLLAPGGTLIYSTCSIDPEENETLVARALATLPALQLTEQHATLPSLTTRGEATHDGGYYAIFTHPASPAPAA